MLILWFSLKLHRQWTCCCTFLQINSITITSKSKINSKHRNTNVPKHITAFLLADRSECVRKTDDGEKQSYQMNASNYSHLLHRVCDLTSRTTTNNTLKLQEGSSAGNWIKFNTFSSSNCSLRENLDLLPCWWCSVVFFPKGQSAALWFSLIFSKFSINLSSHHQVTTRATWSICVFTLRLYRILSYKVTTKNVKNPREFWISLKHFYLD